MFIKNLSAITALSLLLSINTNAADNRDALKAQLKDVQQQIDAAFDTLDGWINGYAAWLAICASLGCNKQAEIVASLRKCKIETPCTPCIEHALAQLNLSPAQSKEALKYIGAIPVLAQRQQELEAQLGEMENCTK